MPAPSALAISTGAVQRLLKEEASYHKELAEQEQTVKNLEEKLKAGTADEDGNEAFMLKQQVRSALPRALGTASQYMLTFQLSVANCHRTNQGRIWSTQTAHYHSSREVRRPARCGGGRWCARCRNYAGQGHARSGQGGCLNDAI